jgi:putative transposase
VSGEDLWFTAAELSGLDLPGMPTDKRNINRMAEREGWQHPAAEGRRWRRRKGRGGGVEYSIHVLPSFTRAKLLARLNIPVVTPVEVREKAVRELSREAVWAAYSRATDKHKKRAHERTAVLADVAELVSVGHPHTIAVMEVATARGVSQRSIYNWTAMVAGAQRHDWAAYLVPQYAGTTGPRAACDDDAWEWLRSAYLRASRPTFDQCWRDLEKVAAQRGWRLPSARTMRRRIDALDPVLVTFKREGEDAAARMFPAQRRDRSMLHALQWVNADGHRFDVFVKWPDGTVARPMVVFFQDLFSGKMLSWRVAQAETGDSFRLAFADLVDRWGIPEAVTIDNTLAAANKTMSGGLKRRFRFKVREEEPLGIFANLGVQVHWARPFSGQSKPIERAFGDFARDIARHPAFAGAYTGNSPDAKPHDYGTKAVKLAEFVSVLEAGIAEHNAREGRTARNCKGGSFDQAFAASYAEAPIRVATEDQRRVLMLAAEEVRVRRDGTIHLLGNRYHHKLLSRAIGRPVVIRFDPDHLHAPVHVFLANGEFLVTADCIADVGFGDTEAARRTAQARKQMRKGIKLLAEAEARISAEQLARDLAAVRRADADAPPERTVIRPLFHGTAALRPVRDEAEDEAANDRFMNALRSHREAAGRPLLRIVPDDDPDA